MRLSSRARLSARVPLLSVKVASSLFSCVPHFVWQEHGKARRSQARACAPLRALLSTLARLSPLTRSHALVTLTCALGPHGVGDRPLEQPSPRKQCHLDLSQASQGSSPPHTLTHNG